MIAREETRWRHVMSFSYVVCMRCSSISGNDNDDDDYNYADSNKIIQSIQMFIKFHTPSKYGERTYLHVSFLSFVLFFFFFNISSFLKLLLYFCI